jgi:hypothetical protein
MPNVPVSPHDGLDSAVPSARDFPQASTGDSHHHEVLWGTSFPSGGLCHETIPVQAGREDALPVYGHQLPFVLLHLGCRLRPVQVLGHPLL